MQEQDNVLFPCPASNLPIQHPVIIDHPKVLPLIYDSASVNAAVAAGELLPFGITSENLKSYIFTDYFSDSVLKLIQNGKITLAPHLFADQIVEANIENSDDEDLSGLECPIVRHYVTDVGALCTRDGRLYDFATLVKVLEKGSSSIFSFRPINPLSDIITHPVHHVLKVAHAQHPQEVVNMRNLLTNFHQPNPHYLNAAIINKYHSYIVALFMLDPFFDYGSVLLGWHNPVAKVVPLIPTAISPLSLIATALIDFKLQYVLAHKTAQARVEGYNFIIFDVQHQFAHLPRGIEVPSWFFYATYLFKVLLTTSGFHLPLIPGFHQSNILSRNSAKTMAVRELLMLYSQYELLRAFSQVTTPLFHRTRQRLFMNQNRNYSYKRLLKRAAEAGLLLTISGVYVYGIHRTSSDIAFYGADYFDRITWIYTRIYEHSLRENHPIINTLGNVMLYPLAIAFSWPELCTLGLATYQMTETLFGNENRLPSIFSLNIGLLLVVAIALIPLMPDYSASSLLDYLISLIILGTKINVADHIRQQVPSAPTADRYRLMPQPRVEEIHADNPDASVLMKKTN